MASTDPPLKFCLSLIMENESGQSPWPPAIPQRGATGTSGVVHSNQIAVLLSAAALVKLGDRTIAFIVGHLSSDIRTITGLTIQDSRKAGWSQLSLAASDNANGL